MKKPTFLSIPVTLNLMYLHFTFTKSIQSEVAVENPAQTERTKEVDVSTYHIGQNNKEKIRQMAIIVDSLEKLGVLDSTKKNCYTVDKIVKSLQVEGDSTYKVGVYFYVKESSDSSKRDTSLHSSALKDSSVNASAEETSSSSSNETEGCAQLLGTPIDMAGSGKVNSANRKASDSEGFPPPKPHKPKLSRTQIMVIATCSTVIGLFFIVAVIMRVRNYIKRNRDGESLQERPMFRSCSVALGGGGSRRSNHHYSSANKSPETEAAYNQVVDETEKEAEEDDPNEPKSSNESRPLLIVTSASAPTSPLPVHKGHDKKPVEQNGIVKYIANGKHSDYTNTAVMDDEDMSLVSMAAKTEDDSISCNTPGSQETLLDDVSDSEMNQPTRGRDNKLEEFSAGSPCLSYDHVQRESSEDTDTPVEIQNEPGFIPFEPGLNFAEGAGLSQSDNSLSDRNQVAYCYGNQAEYYSSGYPGNEKNIPRACSAPPTPEVVRRIVVDKLPNQSLSSECDVAMFLDDDDEPVTRDASSDVIPVSPSSQSPPVYTQAPSSSCHVTNATYQRPKIVVRPPSSSHHVNVSPNHSPVSADTDNMCNYGDDHPLFVESIVNAPDLTDAVFVDNFPNATDNETRPDSINCSKTVSNIDSDTKKTDPPPPDGATGGSEVHSDSEDADSLAGNLSYGERSFLLDPAFEGMEPTYV